MITTSNDFERYLNIRSAYGASFSPDGNTLSFLTNITGVDEVWSVPIDIHAQRSFWPTQLTFRGERIVRAAFSPTSDMLLVSGDIGGSENMQMSLLSADGTTFSVLTEQPQSIFLFGGWSPDGKRICYSSNERNAQYFDIYERDIESGVSKRLFSQDSLNYAEGYSPDGKRMLLSRHVSNVCNQILLLDIETENVQQVTPKTDSIPALFSYVAWSQDRSGLYIVSNYKRQFLSLAYLDLSTDKMFYLTDWLWDIDCMALAYDGSIMAIVTNREGYSYLELFDIVHGWEKRCELPTPTLPAGVIQGLRWSRQGTRLAITLTTPNEPTNIWIWDSGERVIWRATSRSLAGIPYTSFVPPQLVYYQTFDQRQIPALFYLPKSTKEKMPAIVYVHGGPESQALPIFDPIIQYIVAQGYAVFVPNIRGSTGYGYEYQSLDDKILRVDAITDLEYAARWLRDNDIIIAEQIAIMGESYGGFMVLAALTTYPELWMAGIDIAGMANLVTFLENTGAWRRKLRESEYGSLENDREFLASISPVHAVNRILAPVCIIHGANDPRVPVEEAEQMVEALQGRGIPVEYLRFEDEGHGLVKRANVLRAYPTIMRFLEKNR